MSDALTPFRLDGRVVLVPAHRVAWASISRGCWLR